MTGFFSSDISRTFEVGRISGKIEVRSKMRLHDSTVAFQYIPKTMGQSHIYRMNTRRGIVVIDQWHNGPRTFEDRALILAIRLGFKYLRNVFSGPFKEKTRN